VTNRKSRATSIGEGVLKLKTGKTGSNEDQEVGDGFSCKLGVYWGQDEREITNRERSSDIRVN
jgi:hypothetical protein